MVTPKQAKQYLSQLGEFNADPQILLTELDTIRTMCIEGYDTEKATAKGEVVAVHEHDLRTAVAAIKQTQSLIEMLMKMAGDELVGAPDFQFEVRIIDKPKSSMKQIQQADGDELEL